LGEFSPIGRWFTLGSFFENYERNADFISTFFSSTSCVLIHTKTGLGNILGDFFTYSSGHPASNSASDSPSMEGKQSGEFRMVFLHTQNPKFGTFWKALEWKRLVYLGIFMSVWYMYFIHHLAYFVVIWYIFPIWYLHMLYQEIPGNPLICMCTRNNKHYM
jgi:hypothetical protein